MKLRAVLPDELPCIRAMLSAATLPTEDLGGGAVQFIVADSEDGVVGAIGLETFGNVGLLRSLVVRPELRGVGIGGQLVIALETHARENNVDQLVLLTQTAAPFFTARGYGAIDRKDAPHSVQSSAEFRSLCPASATCMIKSLCQP